MSWKALFSLIVCCLIHLCLSFYSYWMCKAYLLLSFWFLLTRKFVFSVWLKCLLVVTFYRFYLECTIDIVIIIIIFVKVIIIILLFLLLLLLLLWLQLLLFLKFNVFVVRTWGEPRLNVWRSLCVFAFIFRNYTTMEELIADYESGALHPGDVKPALSKALNQILQVIFCSSLTVLYLSTC